MLEGTAFAVLQEGTYVAEPVATALWVLVAVLGLDVGHRIGTWYAARSG